MSAALLAWLGTYAIHSTLLLGGVALLARRTVTDDGWRETLWKTAILGSLLTASVQTLVGFRPLGGRFALAEVASSAGAPAGAADTPGAVPGAGAVVAATGPTVGASDPAIPWATLLVLGWSVGAAALLTQLVRRQLRLHRALAGRRDLRGHPTWHAFEDLKREAGYGRPVRLSVTDWCPSPMALGWGEVCVPDRLTTRPPDEQRGALAHELAHIVRGDPSWQLVAAILEATFFFQPLHVLARHRLRDASEHLADDWAVQQTGAPMHLARCLVEVAAWVGARPDTVPTAAAAMTEHGSALRARIERLLRWRRRPSPAGATRTAAGALVLLALGGIAPMIARPRASAADRPAPAPALDAVAGTPGSQATPAARPQADSVLTLLLEIALGETRHSGLAREAVEAFERAAPRIAGPALRRIAFEAAMQDAQKQAAESLGRLPADVALPVLTEIIRAHQDAEVIHQAVEATGRLGTLAARTLLASVARDHWSLDARREALDWLY